MPRAGCSSRRHWGCCAMSRRWLIRRPAARVCRWRADMCWAAGNAYIAEQTKSADFPTTNGAFDRTFGIPGNCPRCAVDNYDAFVTKLNAAGSALVYSTYLGGATDIDDALGIAVDAAGRAYV